MQNDVRLIDAVALRKNLSSRYMNELYPDWRNLPQEIKMRIEMLAKEFRFALDHAPTIDAVPVVRCRDCIFSRKFMSGNLYCGLHETYSFTVHPDGFCSRGAKMDEPSP